MKTAAAYIRVSTTDQLEYSPDSQLRLIKDYAQRNNMFLDSQCIFQDDGISGRNAEKRPAFQKMIACAKQRMFDVILIYSTSRFARNLEDSIVYKSMLQRECGIDVISITQPFVDRKTDMLTSAIYGVMDEWYSIDLAENVKRGMTQKAMSGGFQTSPPLGYCASRNGLEIIEDEAETIRLIFSCFTERDMSSFQIARLLNQKGFKTKRGNPIENRTVEYILTNPIYKGYVRWTPSGKIKRNSDSSGTMIVQSTHAPIISEDIFDMAQEKYNCEKNIRKSKQRPLSECKHWLSGILKCSNCGKSLSLINTKPVSFQCGGYAKGSCLVSHAISASKVENSIFAAFEDILKGTETAYLVRKVKNPTENIEESIAGEKSKTERKLERARAAYLNGIDSIDEYKRNKEYLQSELDKLSGQITQLECRATRTGDKDFKENLKGLVDLLQSAAALEDKQKGIRKIVEKIVFHKSSKSITVYFLEAN